MERRELGAGARWRDVAAEDRRGGPPEPRPVVEAQRRREDRVFDRSRHLVRRMDRMRAGIFVVVAVVVLAVLNAGSTFFALARNAGGTELFGLLRWAAVPAVIALAVRRRQTDALTTAAQLALILTASEVLGLGVLWPMIEHPGISMPAVMGLGLGSRLTSAAAIVPLGAVVVWGARRLGDRRRGER